MSPETHRNETMPEFPEPKKEPKMNRAQLRHNEQLNKEVGTTFNQVTNKFLDFFTASDDPEGHEVKNEMDRIDAKWRVYCKRKNLIPKAYPMVGEYCKQLLSEYLAVKTTKNEDFEKREAVS